MGFHENEERAENAFFTASEPSAPHQNTDSAGNPIGPLYSSFYRIQHNFLLKKNGAELAVERVRVVRRQVGAKVVDPDKPDGYDDYYFHEDKDVCEKKTQIVLHFTAGGLIGSIGILTAGSRKNQNPTVGVHYMVSRAGRIIELCEDKYWGNSSNSHIPDKLVSIELINPGPLVRDAGKFKSTAHAVVCDESEQERWVWDLKKPYRGYQYYYRFTPSQYDSLRRLLHFISISHGVQLRVKPDDRPDAPEESTRYRALDKADSITWTGILSHVNNVGKDKDGHWSKWDIGPAFEWDRILTAPVVFPFQDNDAAISPPPAVYANNEENGRGAYLAGRHRTLHGGVHLLPAKTPAKVKAVAPGIVVAARLAPAGADIAETVKFTESHNGFVLLRHLFKGTAAAAGGGDPPAFPIYSLYMHLAYPKWTGDAMDPYAQVPWAKRLLLARRGSVVDFNPGRFGKLRWVKSERIEKDSRTCTVFDEETLTPEPFTLATGEGDARTALALYKEAPPGLRRAWDSLKENHIVTFHQPYLFVDAGEVIGWVDKAPGQSTAFLHWEIFAPARTGSAKSGIQQLLELDPDAAMLSVKDKNGINYYPQMSDFRDLLKKSLAADEASAIVSILENDPSFSATLAHPEPYEDALDRHRKEKTETFAAKLDPPPSGGLFYGIDIEVSTKGANCKVGGSSIPLDLVFSDENGRRVGDAMTAQLTISGDKAKGRIAVPARAAKLVVSSPAAFLDTRVPAEPDKGEANLFSDLTAHRWRNVLLEHVTEWSEDGLRKLFDAKPEIGFELEKVLPVAWWARQPGAYGEIAGLGSASTTSIFAQGAAPADTSVVALPSDGKVENLHPVTALWLLHRLLTHKKIGFAAQPGAENPEIIYFGWSLPRPSPAIGEDLKVVAVRKDFSSNESMAFKVRGGDRDLLLSTSRYDAGVARLPVKAAFWGSWELDVPSIQAGVDNPFKDVGAWAKSWYPDAPGPTKIEIVAPELAGATLPSLKKSGRYEVRLSFTDNCPKAIEGLVFFKCYSVPAGTSTAGPMALCPKALMVNASRTPDAGADLKYETDGRGDRYVVGSKKPWATSLVSPRMSLKAYADGYRPAGKIRLSVYLSRKVEQLFAAWDDRRVKGIRARLLTPASVDEDGRGVTLRPSFLWSGKAAASPRKEELDALLAEARRIQSAPHESIKVVAPPQAPEGTLKLVVDDPPESGELVLEFDPRPLVDDFVAAAGANAGDRVVVCAGFYAPNGGQYALADVAQYRPCGEEIVELDASLQTRLAGSGPHGLVAQCPTGADDPDHPQPFLSFGHQAGFAELGHVMTATGIEVYAVGGGPQESWKDVPVEIICGGQATPCTLRNGIRFCRVFAEKDLQALGVLGKKAEFTFAVAQTGSIRHSGTRATCTIDPLEPRLVDFAVVDPEAPPSGLEGVVARMFGALRIPKDFVCLLGKAECMPTHASLDVRCQTGSPFADDAQLTKAIKYRLPENGQGLCDEEGYFGAYVAKKALSAKGATSFRFVWCRIKPNDKIWGRRVTERPTP